MIVVDNGSTQPWAPEALAALGPNITVHQVLDATPSPVAAVNLGLEKAHGDLVGVCIDGARMASPRLLRELHHPAVASFHDEYVAIRGRDNARPQGSPLMVGRITTNRIFTDGLSQ